MIHRSRLSLFVTLFISLQIPLHAIELNRVLFKMEQKEVQIDVFQFNFTQNIDFLEMGVKKEVTGSAIFGKEGRMRIAKKDPQEQITISNGKKIWIYTPDFGQVWEGKWKDWVNSETIPRGLVPLHNYVAELEDNFDLSLAKGTETEGASVVFLEARPKVAGPDYELRLSISTETWLPVETMFLSSSARVVTTLSDAKINPTLKNDTFRFKPPPGTDIIPLD